MNRAKIIAACIAVILLAAVGTAVYFSIIQNRKDTTGGVAAQGTESTNAEQEDTALQQDEETGGNAVNGSETAAATTEIPQQTPEPLKTEEVKIINNSPEYDLRMTLTEDSKKTTGLSLEYYYEGTGTVKTFDSAVIPEIEGIFEKRAEDAANDGSYSIQAAYLNAKLAKVYFIVNGKGSGDYLGSDMYVVALADGKVKKIFANVGKYSVMSFSKDYKYLGYSYLNPPEGSALQEASLLEVIDCSADDFAVRNSRTKEDKKIGSNMKPEAVYNYSFTAWYSNNTVKLKQKPVSDKKAAETEVLYDISRNLILDKNGDEISSDKAPETEEEESKKPPAESPALKALKDFYNYLGSENDYPKAMELLDEAFTIKLEIFKQFGISELTKSDISAEDASMFSDMLKAASFDSVVKEEVKDGTAAIHYYQNMELSEDNQVRQPMLAQIKKTEKGWKILLLQDADGGSEPFVTKKQ